MGDRLGVAVVGTGSIGVGHLQALRALDGTEPVAVPVRPERIPELVGAGYAAERGLAQAVQAHGVRLCIVATETGRHVEDGIAAMDHQLDVLIEKPLAPSCAAAARLQTRADATCRQVFVGCLLRFSTSLNTFRALLEQVGRLHAVRIDCRSYLPAWRPQRPYRDSYSARAEEGGVLRDLIHEIDYAGWLFGWPAVVQAQAANAGRLGIGSDEIAEVTWVTAEGCVVSLGLDYLTRPPTRHMSAHGDRGTLDWDGLQGIVTLAVEGQPARQITCAETRQALLIAQAQAFIQAGRGALDPRLAGLSEGLRALAVCDAAREASASGRRTPVRYP